MSADPFARVRKPCTGPYGCTKRVETLAYVARPVCTGCRQRLRNLTARHLRNPLSMVRYDMRDQRRGYWRERRRERYANDPAYRERMLATMQAHRARKKAQRGGA